MYNLYININIYIVISKRKINIKNMKFSFVSKPYADSYEEDVNNIEDFQGEEWELVYDVFVRIVRNFKETYPEVSVDIEDLGDKVRTTISKQEMTEDEFEYFIDILTGHQEDNIINFDSVDYVIRGEIVDEKKSTILDRYNQLVKDFTPELLNIEKNQ